MSYRNPSKYNKLEKNYLHEKLFNSIQKTINICDLGLSQYVVKFPEIVIDNTIFNAVSWCHIDTSHLLSQPIRYIIDEKQTTHVYSENP